LYLRRLYQINCLVDTITIVNKNIELLAPGGDIDSIKAAIAAGANAIYCGLDKFNARNRATNITFDALNGILRLAHQHHCQVFLTINILIVESEMPAIFALLNKLVNTTIDGVIVQDLGLLYLLSHYFKSLNIHASTQLTTHNEGQLKFLSILNATRVNLSRELNIGEIKALTQVAHENNLSVEVFVHGSNCLCFSGICYISSVHGGNSGNRGRCSQPCRDQYVTTAKGKNFPLNLKDNSAYTNVRELADAGVDSLKIEGRIKKFHYVYTVVDAWRKQLQNFYANDTVNTDKSALYKVFNRDFSNAFLKGDIHKDMFIDNPRDHSAIHLSELSGSCSESNIEKAKGDVFDERTGIITSVENMLKQYSIAKAPLVISFTGENGTPLQVTVTTPEGSFTIVSESTLQNTGAEMLNHEMLFRRLRTIDDTEYFIEQLNLDNLQNGLFVPFKELTSIKKRILSRLGSKEMIPAINIPAIPKNNIESKPTLSILIDSPEDIMLCEATTANIYLQIPASFKNQSSAFIELFTSNRQIIPWFQPVMIGDDYQAAIDFLQSVKPKRIITNNTGIAYEAFKMGISWIAGPYMNIVNSFSLMNLKENFHCSGAFISNELSRIQIKGIKKPTDFELHYSIYHPLVLMTTRQCLFHQVTGCAKDSMDSSCVQQCGKSSSITNLKNETFLLHKSKGNYHCLYNETNFLNTDIVTDIPNTFSSFLIDIRDIQTGTRTGTKPEVINLFEKLLLGNTEANENLRQTIFPTTKVPYERGI
jgi:U32 family peptidase